jgi:hypothetical protein
MHLEKGTLARKQKGVTQFQGLAPCDGAVKHIIRNLSAAEREGLLRKLAAEAKNRNADLFRRCVGYRTR